MEIITISYKKPKAKYYGYWNNPDWLWENCKCTDFTDYFRKTCIDRYNEITGERLNLAAIDNQLDDY
jgi:hypothetical protein